MNNFSFLEGPSNMNQAEKSLSSPTSFLSPSAYCSCAGLVPVKGAFHLWGYRLRGFLSRASLQLQVTAPLPNPTAAVLQEPTSAGQNSSAGAPRPPLPAHQRSQSHLIPYICIPWRNNACQHLFPWHKLFFCIETPK